MILSTSPKAETFPIECLVSSNNRFLVGGPDCTILIYDKHEDIRNPYVRAEKKI